jgi:hypothetical protein
LFLDSHLDLSASLPPALPYIMIAVLSTLSLAYPTSVCPQRQLLAQPLYIAKLLLSLLYQRLSWALPLSLLLLKCSPIVLCLAVVYFHRF